MRCGLPRTLFAELQATVGHLEVGVPLPDLAVVFSSDLPAHLKRAVGVRIERLELDIPLRPLCWIECDGCSRSARLQDARSHTKRQTAHARSGLLAAEWNDHHAMRIPARIRRSGEVQLIQAHSRLA